MKITDMSVVLLSLSETTQAVSGRGGNTKTPVPPTFKSILVGDMKSPKQGCLLRELQTYFNQLTVVTSVKTNRMVSMIISPQMYYVCCEPQ